MAALREVFAHFGFTWDKSGLQSANKGVDGLVTSLGAVSAALAGSAFISSVRTFANELDVFDDLSAQTGIATDQLQLFGYAAKVSGSSSEEMFASLTLLQKSLGKTTEATGVQTEALKALGISTKDAAGEPRVLNEVLPEIFRNFGNLKSEAEQAATATALFGRGGIKLLPTLRQGAAGLAKLQGQFEEFGGAVSGETVAAAGEFNDQIARLGVATFALKGALASSLLPRLTSMVESLGKITARFSSWVKGTTLADSAASALAVTIGVKLFSALRPYLGAGLKFAAIFFAVDELLGFLDGKDSLIGDLLDGAFGFGTARAVRDWVNDAIGQLGLLKGSVERDAAILAGTMQAGWLDKVRIGIGFMVNDFATGGELMKAALLSAFVSIANGFDKLILSLEEGWNSFFKGKDAFQIDTTAAKARVATGAETQGRIDDRLQAERTRLQGMHIAARTTSENAGVGAGGFASSVDVPKAAVPTSAVVSLPEINVQAAAPVINNTFNMPPSTAGSPADIAREVGRVQKGQMRNAQASLVARK